MGVQDRLISKLSALGFPAPRNGAEWKHLSLVVEMREKWRESDDDIAESALAWIEREELRLRIAGRSTIGWVRREPTIPEPTGRDLSDYPGVPTRLRRALSYFSGHTLSELRDMSDLEFLRVKDVGRQTLNDLRQFLSQVGDGANGIPGFWPDI